MARWITLITALSLLTLTALPCPAPACSLCDAALRTQNTLREEMQEGKVILFGTIANPQFIKRAGVPAGSGTTDFNVATVIRDDAVRGGRNKLEIPKYLPVTDPDNPPKFLAFFAVREGQLSLYAGRFVNTEAMLTYVAGILEVKNKDRAQQLQYYFKHLDHPDPAVSQDAFIEFARCSDTEVADVAKNLSAVKLRALLQDPKTPAERLSLFAFLLGAAGSDKEAAALLRGMIERPTERTAGALDGLVSGYINLQPREGWELAAKILADGKKPFTERFTVSRMLRFYHAWKPAESKAQILNCLTIMLRDGEMADIATENLREWHMWDLTKEVLAQYGKASHDSPLVRRGIIRYALCCPLTEALQFVVAMRVSDPELVREVEQSLEFEKGR